MSFKPTDEQVAIVEASLGQENLLVIARAGAAKTSTLVLVAQANTDKKILSLAFNTAIKDEMRERMPPNVTCQTLNGCGFQAWQRFLGKRCKVEPRKNYEILRQFIDKLDQADRDLLWENFSETLRAFDDSKTSGVLPDTVKGPFRPLMTFTDFILDYHVELNDIQKSALAHCIEKSWQQTVAGIIDFNDMLLAPAVAGVSFDPYDMVLVDESQDLSPINHVLIKKIVRFNTKLIAVGDPCQAIYGFRGADEQSMEKLGRMFKANTLYLTTTFRCGSSIVENVKWRAADIKAASWAKPGSVERPVSVKISDIPDGAAIICRNNAPIFSMAVRLLRHGRYPELAGRDVVKGLVNIMKKFGKPKISCDEALEAAKEWAEKERKRQKTEGLVDDQFMCIKIFLQETDTLGDAIAFAEKLGQSAGRIKLMTGHKSKGLEFDTVYFLEPQLCRRDRGQDANIDYVICTRAKERLVYITADMVEEGTDE